MNGRTRQQVRHAVPAASPSPGRHLRLRAQTAKLLGALAWMLFPAAILLRRLGGSGELRR